ncbi:MAG: GNAT family N-acetyltransferase [Actinobacteria bacterium]|nr:GNAT family N-acetyltransferase [Actinomycetota bacterium]
MRARLVEPSIDQVLAYCADDPIERVFLEDVGRRGSGRFAALEREDGTLRALCHLGTNVVPSGDGCAGFAELASRAGPRMLIGEQGAVSQLWDAGGRRFGRPRADRRDQPVYRMTSAPAEAGTGLRPATTADLDLLVPACARAHEEELGVDPLRRDANGFRWRTRVQVEEGRSWVWIEDGLILFKAEASAWTPAAVQLQQVWVDPPARRLGYGKRALRDLLVRLLDEVPAVCLFVRAENAPAIRLYETIGMEHVLDYRSVLF